MNDWRLYFNQLVHDMIFKPWAHEFFKKNGIHARHWPTCIAKELALEFEEKIKQRGIDSAKTLLANRIKELELPQEPYENFQILGSYERFKTTAIALELANSILTSPEQLSSILGYFRANRISSTETFDISEALKSAILQQESRLKDGKVVVELPGWRELSNMCGGFNPGRIFLVTAQTGMGKTTLALNLTLSALNKFSVLYFNMEMMPEDISVRLMQIGASVSTKEWRTGSYLSKQSHISGWINTFQGDNRLLITTGKALTLEQIVDKIIQEKELNNVGFVVVDYDQKIRTNNRGEEWQLLQKAVEELEEIAKMCAVPIIILAQGDDDGNPRASKRTAQSASSVMRLHKEDDQYFIEFLKNRFGANKEKLLIDFNTETMIMKEKRVANEIDFKRNPASYFERN